MFESVDGDSVGCDDVSAAAVGSVLASAARRHVGRVATRPSRAITPHLLETVEQLDVDGVGFRSLTEAIDTTTSGGKLIYSIFGALAEFERNLIRERTNLGLAVARAQGRLGGRPPAMSGTQIKQAKRMRTGGMSLTDIREVLGVSRSTLYRHLK